MGLGYVEGAAQDCLPYWTTTLLAALDITTGEVLTRCKRRHRHQEYLQFLKKIDANAPDELDIHIW
jgi:putative transposase